MHTIPIFGFDNQAGDLKSLLRDSLPDTIQVPDPHQPKGVNMDPATLALIIAATKDVLVAAIAAVATVWAARVAAEAGNKRNQPSSSEGQRSIPVIEVDTLTDSYSLIVDGQLELHLREVLPDNIRNVMNIRLRAKQ